MDTNAILLAAENAWAEYVRAQGLIDPYKASYEIRKKYMRQEDGGVWLFDTGYSSEDKKKLKIYNDMSKGFRERKNKWIISWIAENEGWERALTVIELWGMNADDFKPCDYGQCWMFCKNFEECINGTD